MSFLGKHLAIMAQIEAGVHDQIAKIAQQSDAKQWEMAAYELGRLEEMASRLASQCRLAIDALWNDSGRGLTKND